MSHNAPPCDVRSGALGLDRIIQGHKQSSSAHGQDKDKAAADQSANKVLREGQTSKVIVVIDAASPQSASVIESLSIYNEEQKQRLRNILAQELLNPAPPFETPLEEVRGTDYVECKQNAAPSSSEPSSLDVDGAAGSRSNAERSLSKSSTSGPSRRYSEHLPPSLTSPVVKPMISNVPNNFSTTTVHIDAEGVVHPVGLRPITMMNLERKSFHRMEDEKARRLEEDQTKTSLSGEAVGLDPIKEAVGSGPSPANDVNARQEVSKTSIDAKMPDFVSALDWESSLPGAKIELAETISRRDARAQSLYDEIEHLVEQRFVPPWRIHALFDISTPPEMLPLQDHTSTPTHDGWYHFQVKVDLNNEHAVRDVLNGIKSKSKSIHGLFASYAAEDDILHSGLPKKPSDGEKRRLQMLVDVAKDIGAQHFIGSLLADLDSESTPATFPLPELLIDSKSDRRYIHSAAASPSGAAQIKFTTTLSSVLTFTSVLSSRILSIEAAGTLEMPVKRWTAKTHLPLDCLMPFSHAKDVGPAALLAFLDPEEYNAKDIPLVSDLIRPRLMTAQCDQIVYHLKARVVCTDQGKDLTNFLTSEKEWYRDREFDHCWELIRWWLEKAREMSEISLRTKAPWRLTAWRHYVVENTEAILQDWRQTLAMITSYSLDQNEAPTRFDRPPLLPEGSMVVVAEALGRAFDDVLVGVPRHLAEKGAGKGSGATCGAGASGVASGAVHGGVGIDDIGGKSGTVK